MRYIGRKTNLLAFIDKAIAPHAENIGTVFDAFAGTGSVAEHFKSLNKRVTTNDMLYFCYVIQRCLVCNNRVLKDAQKHIDALNALPARANGFMHANYTLKGKRMFFTEENGKKIDTVRQKIEEWRRTKKITDALYFYLLTSLIYAVDKVSNVTGIYTSFLKEFQPNAKRPLKLLPVDTIVSDTNGHACLNKDITQVKTKTPVDLLYMDPPYNERQYSQYYHILETVAKYDHPKIHGVGGQRDDNKSSSFCRKDEALDSLRKVVSNIPSKYVMMSYSSEGIVGKNDLMAMFREFGPTKLHKKKYKRFVSNKKDHEQKATFVYEYLFVCERSTK